MLSPTWRCLLTKIWLGHKILIRSSRNSGSTMSATASATTPPHQSNLLGELRLPRPLLQTKSRGGQRKLVRSGLAQTSPKPYRLAQTSLKPRQSLTETRLKPRQSLAQPGWPESLVNVSRIKHLGIAIKHQGTWRIKTKPKQHIMTMAINH